MKSSVIVIDDHHDVAAVISEMLSLNSINVLATGHDGKEAVELYQKYSPNVVLLDNSMPKFDGLYGLKNILKINSNAKVVIVTGSIEESVTQKLIESGASTILHKPCDMNNLVETVNKLALDNARLLNN